MSKASPDPKNGVEHTLAPPEEGEQRHLPSVADIVGAEAPCDPIKPPPEDRVWDPETGRWVRDGVAIPPDPSRITLPPVEIAPDGLKSIEELGLPHDPVTEIAESDPPPPDPPDDLDTPVPRWAIVLVAAMFGVGLALGVAFVLVK